MLVAGASAGELPALSVEISDLGPPLALCQGRIVTFGLERGPAAENPRDVLLELSGTNYVVNDPGSIICSGRVAPVSCTPVIGPGGAYEWYFADAFVGLGGDALIELFVEKRCTAGAALEVSAHWDDDAHADGAPDRIHSVATSTAPVLVSGELTLEQTPSVTGPDSAVWQIDVANFGSSTATNVWLDDELGAAMSYAFAIADDMSGAKITPGVNHSGAVFNGVSIEFDTMAPGESRSITVVADIVGESELTSDVLASWGCLGMTCQTPVSDSIDLPEPAGASAAALCTLALLFSAARRGRVDRKGPVQPGRRAGRRPGRRRRGARTPFAVGSPDEWQ